MFVISEIIIERLRAMYPEIIDVKNIYLQIKNIKTCFLKILL